MGYLNEDQKKFTTECVVNITNLLMSAVSSFSKKFDDETDEERFGHFTRTLIINIVGNIMFKFTDNSDDFSLLCRDLMMGIEDFRMQVIRDYHTDKELH